MGNTGTWVNETFEVACMDTDSLRRLDGLVDFEKPVQYGAALHFCQLVTRVNVTQDSYVRGAILPPFYGDHRGCTGCLVHRAWCGGDLWDGLLNGTGITYVQVSGSSGMLRQRTESTDPSEKIVFTVRTVSWRDVQCMSEWEGCELVPQAGDTPIAEAILNIIKRLRMTEMRIERFMSALHGKEFK